MIRTIRLCRLAVFAVFIGLGSMGNVAWAHVGQEYTQAAFDRLIAEGKPTVVLVHADWCTTCKAQEEALAVLQQKSEFHELRLLRVDFDAQKDIMKHFRVIERSTLIVFHKGAEAGRSTGETRAGEIEALLRKAL